jgi:hypothetical protein
MTLVLTTEIIFHSLGSVLFLTSPEEPHLSLSKLSLKNESTNNVWNGNYRLVGNKVRED